MNKTDRQSTEEALDNLREAIRAAYHVDKVLDYITRGLKWLISRIGKIREVVKNGRKRK